MTERSSWETEDPPADLYRYRPPEDITAGYLEEVVLQDRVYATSPAAFNDPFDCRVRLSFEGITACDVREVLDSFLRRTRPELRSFERRSQVTLMMKSGRWKNPEAHQGMTQELQGEVDSRGIICLCESGTVPLMWSHYSSGHRGFCLRFKTLWGSLFHEACRVRYSSEYVSVPAFEDAGVQVEAFLLTKADRWSYEKEWRFIGYESGVGHRRFPAEALDAIILGCRMTEDDQARVMELASQRPSPVTVYQAVPQRESYGLDLERC